MGALLAKSVAVAAEVSSKLVFHMKRSIAKKVAPKKMSHRSRTEGTFIPLMTQIGSRSTNAMKTR